MSKSEFQQYLDGTVINELFLIFTILRVLLPRNV